MCVNKLYKVHKVINSNRTNLYKEKMPGFQLNTWTEELHKSDNKQTKQDAGDRLISVTTSALNECAHYQGSSND